MVGAGFLAGFCVALLLVAPPAVGVEGDGSSKVQARAEVPVTAIDLQQERAQNSPTLAVDPTNEDFVVAGSRLDGPEFDCALHVSGDAGRTWLPAQPVSELPESAERCYAPEVAFDADGRLYVLFMGLRGEGNEPMGAFLVTSDDRGRSFTAPRQVLGGHRYMVRLAVDPDHGDRGRLHLIWVKATSPTPTGGFGPPPNPVMATHSDDRGRSWSDPVQVNDPTRDRVVAPAVALGRDGAVHVAYYDLQDDARDYQGLEGPAWDGTWSLVVSSSDDGGLAFSRHREVDDGVVYGERVMLIFTTPPPALAADRAGRLVAAWPDARYGDRDVLVRRSLDSGESWQPPVRVNDDEIGNGRAQLLPQVDIGPHGRVDAVFYDRRDDPDNVRQHVYYAYSPNFSESFSANVRVTAEASDSRTGPSYPIPSAQGLVEFGSRVAVVSQSSGVLMAWTDTRLPFPGLLHQDVFATQVAAPTVEGGWPGGWLLALLVGLLGAGGVGAVGWRVRRRVRVTAPTAIVTMLVLAAAGCTLPGASTEPLPPSAPNVQVGLDEYAFDLPESVPAGRVVFEVVNHGDVAHELVLVGLPESAPRIEDLFGEDAERRAFSTRMQLRRREPGQAGVFAMDLAPGRYGLMCFLEDDDGPQHVHKGMVAEFRVAEPGPAP